MIAVKMQNVERRSVDAIENHAVERLAELYVLALVQNFGLRVCNRDKYSRSSCGNRTLRMIRLRPGNRIETIEQHLRALLFEPHQIAGRGELLGNRPRIENGFDEKCILAEPVLDDV